MKRLHFLKIFLILLSTGVFFSHSPIFSETLPVDQPVDLTKEPAVNFLLRDAFFISPDLKLKYNTYESEGFLFIRDMRPEMNSDFALVMGFDGGVIETRSLKGAHKIEEVQKWISNSVKSYNFMGVTIKSLSMELPDGVTGNFYWIGQKSFSAKDLAEANVISVKTAVESNGGNFERAIKLIEEFAPTEPKAPTGQEILANFEREEEFAAKVMDWLDIGEKLYGPFHTSGAPYGEPILWQSFGETSFRTMNLESPEYRSQTAFWTNRLVFKGLKGPFETTFDPYIELTPTIESNGTDYKSNIKLIGGVEWYPLMRNAALQNYRPWGMPLLDFIRTYRLFAQYMYRENIKDEIVGSKDTDFWAGTDIFYEWGLALPMLGTKPVRSKFSHYLQDYVWGEYYGSYRFELTDFSSIQNYSSVILNSSLTLGVKWPAVPLPANGINDELVFMPYLRFEHVNNPMHSLHYQNYFFTAVGMRLMPFRSYQFSENEWLFKTRLFVEYIGLGGAIRYSANTPTNTPGRDLRFGVQFSYRRF